MEKLERTAGNVDNVDERHRCCNWRRGFNAQKLQHLHIISDNLSVNGNVGPRNGPVH